MDIKRVFKRKNQYAPEVTKTYGISKVRLILKYLRAYITRGCTVKDFFGYRFYLLNGKGRRQFVTGGSMSRWYKKHNNPTDVADLNNKERTLIRFQEFISRDWCGQAFNNTREEYETFAARHSQAIVKPLSSCGGHGIRVINTAQPCGEKSLYDFCVENNYLVEELIEQHPQMAAFNKSSVNTVRGMALRGVIIGAVLRMGVGASCVDNACSGGIYAEVDTDTGIVISQAFNYAGESYLRHPSSDVIILGAEIPLWDKVKEMVSQVANKITGVPLLGVDVAITEDGPTIVELNACPDVFILQNPRREGIANILKD